VTDAATGAVPTSPVADPWPAQAARVLAVLDGGVVHNDHPEGWVRIVNVGVVLHIRRERLEAIRAGVGATAPAVHCAPPS
jgi:hypothetical protein